MARQISIGATAACMFLLCQIVNKMTSLEKISFVPDQQGGVGICVHLYRTLDMHARVQNQTFAIFLWPPQYFCKIIFSVAVVAAGSLYLGSLNYGKFASRY